MSVSRLVVSFVVAGMLLGGCAKPPQKHAGDLSTTGKMATDGVEAIDTSAVTGSIMRTAFAPDYQAMPQSLFSTSPLTGRTLAVASANDIKLDPGEVILTFDDGPRPGKTDAILDTLDNFAVKATFLMVGQAVAAHPLTAQQVALRGHTIGSHSYDHADLTSLSRHEAVNDIARAEDTIVRTLSRIGDEPAPFFRFPYLAQNGFLRTSLNRGSAVILGVDIDSKDYYNDTPGAVAARTLKRLDERGKGIILFHDIHARTVAMLPDFLQQLEDRGYTVVRLVPKVNGPFGSDIIKAEARAVSMPTAVEASDSL
ncbi:polysaccharide deacetylase family protein [Devosia rhodophyticola]|uniref:Chitooligosaccharide deacetylase n=1 Tax=Devosia rhodophyticola TaxID=3026423 RepID=A0ABY7YWU8_9HYPH|nr:polysaccharide deacetylase family protein [Devosia rhodophyticola]WDR05652.1 polysaccharide deacetylase family protein [Devosia rhodophyticola]